VKGFMKKAMEKWRVDLHLNHAGGTMEIKDIRIKNGIFQGDSFSPLIFCMAMDPLSKMLKNGKGYNLAQTRKKKEELKVTHLLFMDDLKIYTEKREELEKVLETVRMFSSDIGMEFGLEKCAKCILEKGRVKTIENIGMEDDDRIKDLEEDSSYKYLGIEEGGKGIPHKTMRTIIKEQYINRVKRILKTFLTIKNKITAINQLAVPAFAYGVGIVDWPQESINELDTRTRKLLTLHKATYRHQCLDRIYLPRKAGGLGLLEVNTTHRAGLVSLGQYLTSLSTRHGSIIRQHMEKRTSERTSVT
jgi:hypothetical protein